MEVEGAISTIRLQIVEPLIEFSARLVFDTPLLGERARLPLAANQRFDRV